ncbi:MAG: hypothetical protein GY772_23825, partial [bacterium]|nr:hypothetical protein [bacterium]
NKDQRPWYQLVSPEGEILPLYEGEAVAAALPGGDDYSTKAHFDRNIHWEAQGRGFTGPVPEEERGRSSSRSSRARSVPRRRRATSEPRSSGAAQSSGWQSGWQSAPKETPKEQEARSWEWTGWQASVHDGGPLTWAEAWKQSMAAAAAAPEPAGRGRTQVLPAWVTRQQEATAGNAMPDAWATAGEARTAGGWGTPSPPLAAAVAWSAWRPVSPGLEARIKAQTWSGYQWDQNRKEASPEEERGTRPGSVHLVPAGMAQSAMQGNARKRYRSERERPRRARLAEEPMEAGVFEDTGPTRTL